MELLLTVSPLVHKTRINNCPTKVRALPACNNTNSSGNGSSSSNNTYTGIINGPNLLIDLNTTLVY